MPPSEAVKGNVMRLEIVSALQQMGIRHSNVIKLDGLAYVERNGVLISVESLETLRSPKTRPIFTHHWQTVCQQGGRLFIAAPYGERDDAQLFMEEITHMGVFSLPPTSL